MAEPPDDATGLVTESEIKHAVRDGRAIQEAVLVYSTIGGPRFFPFFRMAGQEGWVGVRVGRTDSAKSWRQWHVLMDKLRSGPADRGKNGFGWRGDAVQVWMQGSPRITALGQAAEHLR